MNHGIIIHPEDFDDLLGMSNEECGLITKNLINTLLGNDTEEFEDRYLTRVSKDMCGRVLRDRELSERQSEKGKKGGAKVGHTNYNQAKVKPKLSQSLTEVKPKLNPNTNTNTNTNNQLPINNIYRKKTNSFVDGCTKSDIDFENLEIKVVKN